MKVRLGLTLAALAASVSCAGAPQATAQSCAFEASQSWKGVDLRRHAEKDAYIYVTSRVSIDADGAPNAYHPDNTGLDHYGNAGWPNESWWPDVLVPDPADPARPYVQPDGPFKGYFVTKTTLADRSSPATDPAKYVDATTIPYIAFPGGFVGLAGTGRMGDFGYAIHLGSGRASPFIVADVAPRNDPLGEMSLALASALSGNTAVNPRNGAGAPSGDIAYIVFRYSSDASAANRWPLTPDQIRTRVDALLADIGGVEAIRICIP